MPKWYTSPVVSYTRNDDTIFLPYIAAKEDKTEIFTDKNGIEHTHYYEQKVYDGKGLSFAYSDSPINIGTIALVRIEDNYQSGIDENNNPIYVENPIPDIKYASPIVSFVELIKEYPLLANRFIDQPVD